MTVMRENGLRGGRQASAIGMTIGVDLKQFETQRLTWRQ